MRESQEIMETKVQKLEELLAIKEKKIQSLNRKLHQLGGR